MTEFKKFKGAGGEYFGKGSEADKKLWNRLKNDLAKETTEFENVKGKQSPNFTTDIREKHKTGGEVGEDLKAEGGQINMLGTTPDSRPPMKKGGKCK